MTKFLATIFAAALSLGIAGAAIASGTGGLHPAGTDLDDQASLQRGAKLYMNYCAGCHSLKYLRYSRIAADLGLTEDQLQANFNLTGAAAGERLQVALRHDDGTPFFGKMPPDLSVIARVRGSDWIFNYLKSFYLDETRPV